MVIMESSGKVIRIDARRIMISRVAKAICSRLREATLHDTTMSGDGDRKLYDYWDGCAWWKECLLRRAHDLNCKMARCDFKQFGCKSKEIQ